MDVLHYWKDLASDIKADRIGWFRSSKDRLPEFQEGHPDYIWVVRTPTGSKGKLQLLARLAWASKPTGPVTALPGQSLMYYDPDHPHSVWFEEEDSALQIDAVSDWMHRYFPAAVSGNFQGTSGQQALRGPVCQELVAIARPFRTRPFRQFPGRAATAA